MRISEAKECIKELYLNTNAVTALISERGVGKSSAFKQCAKELDIEYIDLYAAALEGPDFMGLPSKDLDKGLTRYLAPQFLPTEVAIENGFYGEKGLLVLEEVNRVPSDTISVLYPLLLENEINGHKLGEGWKIGVTMNPDTMNYLVNTLDDAMIDRFISILVEPSIEDYISYSRINNGNETVLGFLASNPDMLLITSKTGESDAIKKSPTPRGWTKVQSIMNTCKLPRNLLIELLSGIVGSVGAASFEGYITSQSLVVPSTDIMLKDYKFERDKVIKLVEDKAYPILTKVISNLIEKLDTSESMMKEVDLFIEDLPEELCVLFYKVLSREHDDIYDYYSEKSAGFIKISKIVVENMMA